ncbi:hypothetical protein MMC06_001044 [Schaereria dolodes]|nr:hypothetical protein [Schaereria dolodes]
MFSYLHGIRPNGRRTAAPLSSSTQENSQFNVVHDRSILHAYSAGSPPSQRRIEGDTVQPASSVLSNPPVLPPIPRVASQHDQQVHAQSRCQDPTKNMQHAVSASLHVTRRHAGNKSTERVRASIVAGEEDDQSRIPIKSSRISQEEAPEGRPTQTPQYRPPETLEDSGRSHSSSLKLHPNLIQDDISRSSQNMSERYPGTSKLGQHPGQGSSQIRHSKTKLNLLNPMSLLARRRSAQVAAQASDELLVRTKIRSASGVQLPDDYDPRIRGKVVHDFSAPRPKRFLSYDSANIVTKDETSHNKYSKFHMASRPHPRINDHRVRPQDDTSPLKREESSPINVDRAHTPVFKEHFGDDVEPWKTEEDDEMKQKSQDLAYGVMILDSRTNNTSLPPFARNLPVDFLHPGKPRNKDSPLPLKAPLNVVSESTKPDIIFTSKQAGSSPPTKSPRARSRATSAASFQSVGLPKHLNSNASRFSFDLAGVGSSAQEQLLEEKHRRQVAQRSRSSRISTTTTNRDPDGSVEEDFEYGDMDDIDGLEERIPGVNADADEALDEAELYANNKSMESFNSDTRIMSPLVSPTSAISTGFTSIEIAEDSQEDIAEISDSSHSPEIVQRCSPTVYQQSCNHGSGLTPSKLDNLCINDPQISAIPKQQVLPGPVYKGACGHAQSFVQDPNYEEDDLYFDDGLIEDIDEGEGLGFDESVFDDDSGRIHHLSSHNLKPSTASDEFIQPAMETRFSRPMSTDAVPFTVTAQLEGPPTSTEVPNDFRLSHSDMLAHNSSLARSAYQQEAGLTQGNLAAYHDALALATTKAALEGKFDRKRSQSNGETQASYEESRSTNTIPDAIREQDERALHNVTGDTEGFDFDDALEDDPIIAAANAEALENDDDEFYGQEFGFYAHANGSEEAHYANGGYFGPKGVEGVNRSHSGRVNFQEPNLTPITERSEWSHRNSTVSLALHGGYSSIGPSVSSTGLTQLVDMIPLEDESISLSALMKLRRGAWGGSNASLRSSTGSHNSGSPITYLPPMASNSMLGNNGYGNSNLAGSSYSLVSSNGITSDDEQSPESPTITLPSHGLAISSPVQTRTDKSTISDSSSIRWIAAEGPGGHSRTSSGAESVSYVKENDEDGSGRWVLEKRRTAEGGVVEILGRQIVEGGRI